MKDTVVSSRAVGTVTSYLRSLRKWKEFTESHSSITFFPAEPSHVAIYLQHLFEVTKSYHSVDAAFYAIQWCHNLAGLPAPTDNVVVSLVREGIKRSIGTHKVNRKEPLKLEHLNGILLKANLDNTLELRNVCMYSLAFAGLLRFDDLIRIRRNDVIFSVDHLRLVITKSKNDQLREGNEVLISDSASSNSPVKLLRHYLLRLMIPDDCTKLIFRPLVRVKAGHRVVEADRHISYTTFRESLKADLVGIVDNPSKYSSHSLRSGGATLAANSGFNDRIIQRHGRWRCASSKDMYIDDDISKKLEISKSLQSV